MYEKVNPMHPDKIADRIAGALVDLAMKEDENAKVAIEVLVGHGICNIMTGCSEEFEQSDIFDVVERITGEQPMIQIYQNYQDKHLAANQEGKVRCGDNGIFRGVPISNEEHRLAEISHKLYDAAGTDGKYIINGDDLIVCQSCMPKSEIERCLDEYNFKTLKINPLGNWTGGLSVDSGVTNRKLGSDMGRAVTGGGLCGKDLSKADVSVNIYCHLLAQAKLTPIKALCAIGDEQVKLKFDGGEWFHVDYEDIVADARRYINELGGFEALAEWGLIR